MDRIFYFQAELGDTDKKEKELIEVIKEYKTIDENIEIPCINLLVLKEEDFKKIYNTYYKKDLGEYEDFIIKMDDEGYEKKIIKSGLKGVNIFMSYLL